MEGRRKRVLAVLLAMLAVAGIAVTAASAKRAAGTLNIYGYGPGDDVQENRAAYAKDQLSGTTIKAREITSAVREETPNQA